ncbi:hypothetical protein SUGI_0203240 [Cryptomeria japonica]|nr:hypothetical protein SUGI_0203240 [Cryptomeria japonica]
MSLEDTLELEPMVSYHRMLLHRLADIFGLVHESVGEGDDRHLIVERCEDSSIPAVLVSDILEWQYGETQSQQAACQLLKRKIALPDLQQKQIANQLPSISFEEREAAYLAARERIFSLSSCEENGEQKEQATPRPRTVPVVARRMIAHALGKRIMVDASCEKPDIPKIIEAPQVDEKTLEKFLNGALPQVQVQHAVRASSEESPAAAVKIMINNYLNGDVSCTYGKVDTKVTPADMKTVQRNPGDLPHVVGAPHFTKDGSENPPVIEAERVPVKMLNSKILCMDDKMTDKSLISEKPFLDEKLPDKSWINTSEVTTGVQQPVKASLGHMPAAAAKRMFAQALGLPLANGPLKSTIESTSRLGIGSSNASETETFQDDTSYQNAPQFKVSVEQDRNKSSASKVKPEQVHQSRVEAEPPSTSESQGTNSQNHLLTGRIHNKHIPGRAAQRLFAQALGIQSTSSTCMEGNRSRNSSFTSTALRGLPAGHKPGASSGPSNAIHNSLASDSERHTLGSSLKQLGDERVFASSVSYKGRKNIRVNTNNTNPKTSGRARHTNNSGPIKTKHSNYRIASTCSADETGFNFKATSLSTLMLPSLWIRLKFQCFCQAIAEEVATLTMVEDLTLFLWLRTMSLAPAQAFSNSSSPARNGSPALAPIIANGATGIGSAARVAVAATVGSGGGFFSVPLSTTFPPLFAAGSMRIAPLVVGFGSPTTGVPVLDLDALVANDAPVIRVSLRIVVALDDSPSDEVPLITDEAFADITAIVDSSAPLVPTSVSLTPLLCSSLGGSALDAVLQQHFAVVLQQQFCSVSAGSSPPDCSLISNDNGFPDGRNYRSNVDILSMVPGIGNARRGMHDEASIGYWFIKEYIQEHDKEKRAKDEEGENQNQIRNEA